jgi:predicted protein tyrosine phosphatase
LSRYSVGQKASLGEFLHSHCISITDPAHDMPADALAGFVEVLPLCFYDIEDTEKASYDERRFLPEMDHIQQVVGFYERVREETDGFTIHCHAGVHRSTAVGLVILYLECQDESLAKQLILKTHPLPIPNRRIIKLADQVLSSNIGSVAEELRERARKFMKDEIEIDRDDYLPELEQTR